MHINLARIDIEKTRGDWPEDRPFQPAYVQPIKQGEPRDWLVAGVPLVAGEEPAWDLTFQDEFIRIPLFEYVLSPQADLGLAFMLQLGLSCAGFLGQPISHFFVVTGTPVELVYDPQTNEPSGLRCWIGFAVILEKGKK